MDINTIAQNEIENEIGNQANKKNPKEKKEEPKISVNWFYYVDGKLKFDRIFGFYLIGLLIYIFLHNLVITGIESKFEIDNKIYHITDVIGNDKISYKTKDEVYEIFTSTFEKYIGSSYKAAFEYYLNGFVTRWNYTGAVLFDLHNEDNFYIKEINLFENDELRPGEDFYNSIKFGYNGFYIFIFLIYFIASKTQKHLWYAQLEKFYIPIYFIFSFKNRRTNLYFYSRINTRFISTARFKKVDVVQSIFLLPATITKDLELREEERNISFLIYDYKYYKCFIFNRRTEEVLNLQMINNMIEERNKKEQNKKDKFTSKQLKKEDDLTNADYNERKSNNLLNDDDSDNLLFDETNFDDDIK